MTRLRPATGADVAAIAALHADSWQRVYRGVLSDAYLDGDVRAERLDVWRDRFERPEPNQFTFVAELDGGFVGFAHSYADEDSEWGTLLDNLHVADDRKGTGIGRALVVETARWVQVNATQSRLYLWVLPENGAARGFYERIGGQCVGDGTWETPDGGSVPELRYAWTDLDVLVRGRDR